MKRLLTCVTAVICMIAISDQSQAQAHNSSPWFPLAEGNSWEFSVYSSILDAVIRQDTVRIIDEQSIQGKTYWRLSTPWLPVFDTWVRPDSEGNLLWCSTPGGDENPLFLYANESGAGWRLNRGLCIDSATREECYGPIVTPAGAFDNPNCMTHSWRPGDCEHVGWRGVFIENVGPVRWTETGPAGSYLEWNLLEIAQAPPSACKCHGDPVCDGVLDILDVIATVNIAFRGAPPLIDRGCSWYAHQMHGRTDVDKSGATDIFDVARIVAVVFRGAEHY